MIKENKRDQEAFTRESTLESLKQNMFLELNNIILVAETGSFYKIVSQVTDIPLQNNLYAKELDLKQIEDLKLETHGILGRCDGTFPITIAEKGKVYYLKQNNKFYICEDFYEGEKISAPNSNFKELSVLDNHKQINELDIPFKTYNSIEDATNIGEPYQTISFNINNQIINKYIGMTEDIDQPKASIIRYDVDGKIYAVRKYKGVTNMTNYMKNNYVDYKTITKLPDDFPFTSDATIFTSCFNGCLALKEIDDRFDTKSCKDLGLYVFDGAASLEYIPVLNLQNCKKISYSFYGCCIHEINLINTNNIKDYQAAFQNCKNLVKVTGINTINCIEFKKMFAYSGKLVDIPIIDFTSLTLEDITINKRIQDMFVNCNSLKSVTINNVPNGITLDEIRTVTSAPSTCELIINYRNEEVV